MTTGPSGPPARNIRLRIAYDGTPYLGWQVQPQGPTVQAVLQEKIAAVTGEPASLKGSGRTDAGVHALAQTANFHTTSRISPAALVRALNSLLPPAIAVLDADEVPPSFDAQFSAVGKLYRYRLFNSTVPSPFEVNRSWLFTGRLNIEAISQASRIILGLHDFSSFRASGCVAGSPIRDLRRCDVSVDGLVVTFELEANGFLRHMVRNIVGTLVECGRGRFSPADVGAILQARDRTRAGLAAPAAGLYLVRVDYDT